MHDIIRTFHGCLPYIALSVTLLILHTNLQTARNCSLIFYCRFFSGPLSFIHINSFPAHCVAQFLTRSLIYSSLSLNFSTIHSPTHLSSLISQSVIHSLTHLSGPIYKSFTHSSLSTNFSTIQSHTQLFRSIPQSFIRPYISRPISQSFINLHISLAQFSTIHSPTHLSRPIFQPLTHPRCSLIQFLNH
jgi:hypothetical protein